MPTALRAVPPVRPAALHGSGDLKHKEGTLSPGSVRTLTTLAAALIGAAGLVLAAYIEASSRREEAPFEGFRGAAADV